MQLNDLIRKYIKIRDAKDEFVAAHKKELARYTNAMKKIEEMILNEFNETGQESAKTKFGTAYVSTKTSARVVSRDDFFGFVREQGAWDILEARANTTAVKAFMEEHDTLPPGVNVTRVNTINIRRS